MIGKFVVEFGYDRNGKQGPLGEPLAVVGVAYDRKDGQWRGLAVGPGGEIHSISDLTRYRVL